MWPRGKRSAVGKGRAAEEDAAVWLRRHHGYVILERNYRTPAGEIDLIARDGDTVCFVEVKSRARTDFGSAVMAVDRRKQQRIVRAASLYLAKTWSRDGERLCRFDVLGLERGEGGGWSYRLIKGAFEAEG